MGVPALRALGAGYDGVYIALLTDGGASSVRGKLGLDVAEFVAARDREFTESCLRLGYKPENIIIPAARIPDGKLTVDAAKPMIERIIALLPAGSVTAATISPNGTPKQHTDHHALGQAALELYRSGKCRRLRALELYLEPYIYSGLDDRSLFRTVEAPRPDRLNAAADSYRTSQYGIAFISVPREIEAFLAKPEAYMDMITRRRVRNLKKRVRAKLGSLGHGALHFAKAGAREIIRPFDRIAARSFCRVVPFDEKKFTCTDYIYNRPDLFSDNFETVRVSYRGKEYYIEADLRGDTAELSTRLTRVPADVLNMACEFLFRRHEKLEKITVMQSYVPVGTAKVTNHFRVVLPKSEDELMERLPRHTRKNIIRRLKLLREEVGEVTFEEYAGDDISDELVEIFFRYKKISHNREYNMTPREYLKRYHVTDAYVMKVNGEVAAVRFTCEQRDIVNAENFSYDMELSKYSPGLQIYTYNLKRLIEKGKTQIFLSDGHQPQKLLFGSINEKTYNCTVARKDFDMKRLSFLRRAVAENKRGGLYRAYRKLRRADDSAMQRMCFFDRGHIAEEIELPDGLSFSSIDNAWDFEQFCKKHASSLSKLTCFLTEDECDDKNKIIERFENGSVFCAIHDDKTCISTGWIVAGGDFRISEVDTDLYMPTRESAILFDFHTEKEFRGRGLYPLLLRLMMAADTVSERYVIYAKPTNKASLRGIEKAGFEARGEYYKYSVHSYFERLGWKIR